MTPDNTPRARTDGAPAEEDAQLASLYEDLAAVDLHPLWTITRDLLPPTPRPRSVPWLWSSRVLTELAERALRLVPVERGGERRVLSLGNPGLAGLPYAAGTLWGAIQCLGPGETAPAHRHTPGAIRFILSGDGVATTVDGDVCDMHAGDLILTPSWNWHDHSSASDGPMLWFDGLDLPMIEALDAVFFEPYPEVRQPDTDPHNRSEREAGPGPRFVSGAVRDVLTAEHSPLLVYRWANTDRELSRLAAESGEPLVSLEYVNPETGASVLPTMSCGMHRLIPGARTLPVRRTGNAVFVVHRGSGSSVIEGQRFDWSTGDMFVVPSWAAVEHTSTEGADLFSIGDSPVLRALGIHRELTLDAPQQVTGVFTPAALRPTRPDTERERLSV
ncbi:MULTISPECIES: cupin domain-containing protein [unclassified Streptomyces]|uniref:cupin domain-containing protein n=1 Tax=unclassified Streptomyces TaxID=2593676 RepID=UPI00081DFB2E|nr:MULTISPECIES: cupin domain-containing protein [unclassified Streptomyces]MYZ35202.1 cupin domain-containing protein [Streptomyces sp. SID4917]SCF73583.1 gentisate 1,2-dioxygenase [Streptomyces sp. MnatMP-M17]